MNSVTARALVAWKTSQRLRFVAVGLYNTAFGYACFVLLFLAFGGYLHYLVIQVIAHFLSVCNSFFWHRRVTFRSSSPWLTEFLRFNFSYIGALAFGLVVMPVLVSGLGLHPLLAAAIITASTAVLSYALHRKFSFRSQ